MRCLPFRHDWRPRSWHEVFHWWGDRRLRSGSKVTYVCSRCGKAKVKGYDAILTEDVIKDMRP
jgi:hypothetical protein